MVERRHAARTDGAPTNGARARAVLLTLLVAALPWLWFAVRDAGVAADVVAIVLPMLVALAVVVAFGIAALRRGRRLRPVVFAVSTLVVGMVAVLGPWVPSDAGAVAGRGVTVAGANVDYQDTPTPALLDLDADLLVVSELAPDTVDDLAERYPYRYVAGGSDSPLGVFSRYPLRLDETEGPGLPGARLQVDGPDGAFVLYALHIPRPWFSSEGGYQATVSEHYALAEQVSGRVRAERLPAVVVGDLNSTDRGRDYRTLVRDGVLDDAMLERWAGPTSVGKWLPLLGRIDHVLVSEGWCGDGSRRIELPGSSHRAVAAVVGPCAAHQRVELEGSAADVAALARGSRGL